MKKHRRPVEEYGFGKAGLGIRWMEKMRSMRRIDRTRTEFNLIPGLLTKDVIYWEDGSGKASSFRTLKECCAL